MHNPATNVQLVTKWENGSRSALVTRLENRPIRDLKLGEILVEVLMVPLHGSFWLATHPHAIHPRKDEFLKSGEFVFGNGGVGKVIAVEGRNRKVKTGDYVAIFGHAPCDHYNCYACTVLHRYTECDYRENTIMGHGKGANDGTLARYAILPEFSWEVCFREYEHPTMEQLRPFMFAFLLADVRNALTRHPDTLRQRRMLLFGGGLSGQIAAYIHLYSCLGAKILAVEPNEAHAKAVKSINPEKIETYILPRDIAEYLEENKNTLHTRERLTKTIAEIADKVAEQFHNRKANLIFDCSSGNTAPLWDNNAILSSSAHCIPFGFGSEDIVLNKKIIQLSGLNILMSRGVGNIRNRKEVIELIKSGGGEFIEKHLVTSLQKIGSLNELESFIDEMHNPPAPFYEIPHVYVTPQER